MKQIKEDWTKVYNGSKIFVKDDYEFIGLDKTKEILKAGYYYICGFWCDAMGLSHTKEGHNDVVIPSKALIYFYR